jgi:hypothetical protein
MLEHSYCRWSRGPAGPAHDIVHGGLQRPFLPVRRRIFDEDGVGVVPVTLRRLQDDARAEGIRAMTRPSCRSTSICDEFVACEQHPS